MHPSSAYVCREYNDICLEPEDCPGTSGDWWRGLLFVIGLQILLTGQTLSVNTLYGRYTYLTAENKELVNSYFDGPDSFSISTQNQKHRVVPKTSKKSIGGNSDIVNITDLEGSTPEGSYGMNSHVISNKINTNVINTKVTKMPGKIPRRLEDFEEFKQAPLFSKTERGEKLNLVPKRDPQTEGNRQPNITPKHSMRPTNPLQHTGADPSKKALFGTEEPERQLYKPAPKVSGKKDQPPPLKPKDKAAKPDA